MTTFINTLTRTDRSAVSTCLLGSRLRGTGLSGVVLGGSNVLGGGERPTKAPAVAAAAAQASAYALGAAARGAGEASQKQQHTMWAFRGHEPWRDPA